MPRGRKPQRPKQNLSLASPSADMDVDTAPVHHQVIILLPTFDCFAMVSRIYYLFVPTYLSLTSPSTAMDVDTVKQQVIILLLIVDCYAVVS